MPILIVPKGLKRAIRFGRLTFPVTPHLAEDDVNAPGPVRGRRQAP